MNNPRIEINCI